MTTFYVLLSSPKHFYVQIVKKIEITFILFLFFFFKMWNNNQIQKHFQSPLKVEYPHKKSYYANCILCRMERTPTIIIKRTYPVYERGSNLEKLSLTNISLGWHEVGSMQYPVRVNLTNC